MNIKKFYYGNQGPVILWGTYNFRENEIEQTMETIRQQLPDAEYTVVAVEVDDWFRQFSPWPSDQLDSKFAGEAEKTWQWMEEYVLPECGVDAAGKMPDRKIYIMGYSLAGLFALWALMEKPVLSGAISCSGSLWYPDFMGKIQNDCHKLHGKKIYLSVGGKEANTKDPLMANVLTCTKETYGLLKDQNAVKYELNSGGHFADAGKRLAKGLRWVLEEE